MAIVVLALGLHPAAAFADSLAAAEKAADSARISAAINHTGRSTADRERDQRGKPQDVLTVQGATMR